MFEVQAATVRRSLVKLDHVVGFGHSQNKSVTDGFGAHSRATPKGRRAKWQLSRVGFTRAI